MSGVRAREINPDGLGIFMASTDGESCRSAGQPCQALLKFQGQQCEACGAGCGPLVGPVYAHLPADLQLEFKWFFNDVLAPAPAAGGTAPAVPHWKSVIIRAIGNMLHALMIFGVSYTVVTHASQHNPDGSHKTIQAEGSARREDSGRKAEIRKANRQPAGGNEPEGDLKHDGILTDRQSEPHRPSWVDEIKCLPVAAPLATRPAGRIKTSKRLEDFNSGPGSRMSGSAASIMICAGGRRRGSACNICCQNRLSIWRRRGIWKMKLIRSCEKNAGFRRRRKSGFNITSMIVPGNYPDCVVIWSRRRGGMAVFIFR